MGSIIRPSLLPLCYCMVTVQCSAVRGQGERLNTLRVLLLLLLFFVVVGQPEWVNRSTRIIFPQSVRNMEFGKKLPSRCPLFYFFFVVPSQRPPVVASCLAGLIILSAAIQRQSGVKAHIPGK